MKRTFGDKREGKECGRDRKTETGTPRVREEEGKSLVIYSETGGRNSFRKDSGKSRN